jgi:hypothetical protein
MRKEIVTAQPTFKFGFVGERGTASGGLEPFCKKVLRTPKTFKKNIINIFLEGFGDS